MALPSFHGIFSSLDQEQELAASMQSGTMSADDTAASTSIGPKRGQVAVDIFEQNGYYIIRAPIAGVRLSDIEIEIDGKEVTIHGTRTINDDIAEDQYYLKECYWGDFHRSITLPIEVDPKSVKATFSKDSVLKVLIPKKEEKVKIVRVND